MEGYDAPEAFMTLVSFRPSCLIDIQSGRGNAVAIRMDDVAISYAELDRRVARATAALGQMGVSAGRAFSVIGENCPEILIAYYAAARLGAVFISVNAGLKVGEVRYILKHSDSVLLLHDSATAGIAARAAGDVRCADFGALSELQAEFSVDHVDANSDFMIAYTSGTTGLPKAVVFSQAVELAASRALIELWAVTSADRIVVALPLGFLYGLSTASAMGIEAGAEIILLRRFHPKKVIDTLIEHRATVFHGVPTMFAMMLDYCEQNNLRPDLSFMRILVCAGAPLAKELKSRFAERFNKSIDDYYALTEIRPVFGRPASENEPIPAGAIGRAAPGTDIRIVDAQGQHLGQGKQGEILVRAAGTMLRYHKDPELTSRSFRDGYFATGDVGYQDENGYYFLAGRIKDIIIRGGANIAPAEVESTLLQHPDVRAVAVVGEPDPRFGEVPVAFVVWTEDSTQDRESVLAYCHSRLADFKVPSRLLDISELPLGPTGKVDKAKLKSFLE